MKILHFAVAVTLVMVFWHFASGLPLLSTVQQFVRQG